MTYSHTSGRLSTDAKIVLERAGYIVSRNSFGDLWVGGGRVKQDSGMLLIVASGLVDNNLVVSLLAAAGFNEFGYKVGANDKA